MMAAGEFRKSGSRRSKLQGIVSPVVKLSGKRAAVGQYSEKLVYSTEGAILPY